MTLEVAIEGMKCASYGITMIGGSPNPRYERLGLGDEFAWIYWAIDNEAGLARASSGHTVKLRPFLGSIGLCPDLPGYINNMAPSNVGGNIDCKELVAGSKLYLPIEVPEALFSFGDGHAAQSDGEIGGSAIECPMEDVTLTLRLREDFPVTYPIAKTPDAWITFGFAENVHDATYIAVNNALDLMTAKLGMSRVDAAMLAGMIIDLRVTQIVNPIVGVHAVWRDDALV
jgi:acetamidase/formamidase